MSIFMLSILIENMFFNVIMLNIENTQFKNISNGKSVLHCRLQQQHNGIVGTVDE